MLHVEAVDSPTLKWIAGDVPIPEFKKRFEAVPDWRETFLSDAGHMVHHDQPEHVAALDRVVLRLKNTAFGARPP